MNSEQMARFKGMRPAEIAAGRRQWLVGFQDKGSEAAA